ncbi:MAG: hypothetical protein Q8K58_07380 [Acidimicrobiales bacterium]|nr:hypothetical protein [Acidimicrobiales bacterium]
MKLRIDAPEACIWQAARRLLPPGRRAATPACRDDPWEKRMLRSRSWRAVACLTALAALTTACGDDDDADEDTTDQTAEDTADETTTSEAEEEGEEVTVAASDYKFEGVPEEMAAGTTILLENASTTEVHEIGAFRVADEETRSAEELVVLPEEELRTVFSAGPAAVIVALPGEDSVNAVGDGTLTEPGRYVFICAVPVGGDVEAFRTALETHAEGPPEAGDGPPHFTQGMYAETTVS